MSRALSKILPVIAVGVSSCALYVNIVVGCVWGTVFNTFFLLFSASAVFAQMK